jgi:hypothetical protein
VVARARGRAARRCLIEAATRMKERRAPLLGVDDARDRQELGRGRRRHRRSHRFHGVLRARDAALRRPAGADADAGGEGRHGLPAARRGAVIPPWNFPLAIASA